MTNVQTENIYNMTPEQYEEWLKQIQSNEEEENKVHVLKDNEPKKVYRWDVDNYRCIGEYLLQPDPMYPGRYLSPENITEKIPPEDKSDQNVYWNPTTEEWYYKPVIDGFSWYSIVDGSLVRYPLESNLPNMTKIKPLVPGLMSFDKTKQHWNWNLEKIKLLLKNHISRIKQNLLREPLETKHGTFNAPDDIIPILKDYVTTIGKSEQANIRTYSNDFVSLSATNVKEVYKEAVTKRETILVEYWKCKEAIDNLDETVGELIKKYQHRRFVPTEESETDIYYFDKILSDAVNELLMYS